VLKTNSRTTQRAAARGRTRRTTLTLPEEILRKVERMAAKRHQTVSSAIAYLVEAGLRNEPQAAKNSRDILELWRKAYVPLTEEERLLVDGIILTEPIPKAE